MTDPHLSDLISAFLDGELAPDEIGFVQAHLAGCPSCTAETIAVSRARYGLRGLPPVDPPFGLYERLLRRPPVPASAIRRRVGLGVLAVSAAASVVLLGLTTPEQREVAPPVTQLVEAHAVSASVGGDPLSELAPAGVPVTFRP